MLTPETALAFFAAALLLAVAPGPDNIFVLTQSAVYGAGAGVATTFGLVTGLCVHTTAVALGVAALFQSSALAFTLLKAAGALYLLRLAWLSFRAGAALALTPEAKPPFPGYLALYRRGIVLNVTNPKVSLFFLALRPGAGQCGPAGASTGRAVHAGHGGGVLRRGRPGGTAGPLVQPLAARADAHPPGSRNRFCRAGPAAAVQRPWRLSATA